MPQLSDPVHRRALGGELPGGLGEHLLVFVEGQQSAHVLDLGLLFLHIYLSDVVGAPQLRQHPTRLLPFEYPGWKYLLDIQKLQIDHELPKIGKHANLRITVTKILLPFLF